MGPDKKHHIKEVLAEVAAGSQQKAMGNKWGIAESTLSTRKKGTKPYSKAHQHQQILSPLQKKELAKWIIDEENAYFRELDIKAENIVNMDEYRQILSNTPDIMFRRPEPKQQPFAVPEGDSGDKQMQGMPEASQTAGPDRGKGPAEKETV
ncbi:hypothetical protein DL768_006780 [Monosporascus sp. mg162]|nr:hypothetical protein DL768_006780 [Monosporascus sp. mg162]